MRTPEHLRGAYNPRAGKKFEEDLNMTYLAPGAFTVLHTPERGKPPPEPTSQPPSHRLPTTTKRHRHQSFAIIGEVNQSNPGSRSTSPTGRVSPFKGRGFNPAGSRLASPCMSPVPPDDPRTMSPRNGFNGASKIPVRRRGSNSELFGEKVVDFDHNTKFNNQLSRSLTNLAPKNLPKKPPGQKPSPRKRHKTISAFQELSPIAGSSPEPSQSLSSPSRIPTKSRSTPPSRKTSPTRNGTRTNLLSRTNSRARGSSRDPSPSQIQSPTRIPAYKRYQNVQPKIDTRHKPKNAVSSEQSEDSDNQHLKNNNKRVLSRQKSVSRKNSVSNLLPKTQNYNSNNKNSNYTSDSSDQNVNDRKKVMAKRNSNSKINTNVNNDVKNNDVDRVFSPLNDKHSSNNDSRLNLNDLGLDKISPNAVISSTTNAVTKPLHIDIESRPNSHKSPIIDGRVLSATSVSNAINKMNDTVLNTQTLIKEHSFFGNRTNLGLNGGGSGGNFDLHDAVKTMEFGEKIAGDIAFKTEDINVKNDSKNKIDSKVDEDKKNIEQTEKIKSTEEKTAKIPPNNTISVPTSNSTTNFNQNKPVVTQSNNHSHSNNNHVTTIGLNNPAILDSDAEKTINRLLGSRENSLSSMKDNLGNKISANDRIREQRTVIAADVKPIRITVKEKAGDGEVQSGNIGVHRGISNGLNERPSLPPTQNQSPPPNEEAPKEEQPPQNACKRFFTSCTQKLSCNRCKSCKREKKTKKTDSQEELTERESREEVKTGCLNCLSQKFSKSKTPESDVRINIEQDEEEPKRTFWQKLQCCKNCKRNKNKVGDSTGCCPIRKRKTSWLERPESVMESMEPVRQKCCSKEGCKNFFANLFCCRCCRKKKVEEIPVSERKMSMVSSKKKSLTPGTTLPPPEEQKPKIDASLVEHTSHMKAAIPVLPVWLAWFCCVMNCIGPGTGTILSGLFCLCIGKPRFSQKDGPKPRIGAFIINLIIGISQFFTILFCLVGWGWSIWWGVIMVKIAKRHKKLKHLENLEEVASRPIAIGNRRQQETKT